MLIKKILIFMIIIGIAGCSYSKLPHRVLADPNQSDITSIIRDAYEAYIVVYNPNHCDQIGDACDFFLAHAYAHYILNHPYLKPKYYETLTENQADCHAAKHSDPHVIQAAVKFLEDENRDPNIIIRGDALKRAENIRNCAIEAGNWTKS